MANSKISALTAASTPLAGTEVLPVVQSGVTKQVSVANLTAGRTVDVSILLASSTNVDGNWKVQANATSSGVTGIGVNNNGGYGFYITYDNTARYSGGGGSIRNIANTPIYVETNNTIIGQFTTAGNYKPIAAKGIDYSANTPAAGMTSQLLNWYEEGTWTPAYKSTNNNMTIASYDLQEGNYVRIGRMVICNFRIATNTVTSAGTGNIQISGLPFTSKSSGPWGTMTVAYSSNGFLASGMISTSSTVISITGRNTTSAQSSIYEVATTNFGATGGYGNYIIGCAVYNV